MGWDAYSSAEVDYSKNQIIDENIRRDFERAEREVKLIAKSVDGLLSIGGLDCSLCRDMLQKATGILCYEDLTAEQVKEINKKANWYFHIYSTDLWAYFSAKFFLETCAKNNLSMTFQY